MALKYRIDHVSSDGQTVYATWQSATPVTTVHIANGPGGHDTITTVTTRTLHCAGKIPQSNIEIEAKTLNCSGKIMQGNIVITTTSSREEHTVTLYVQDLFSSTYFNISHGSYYFTGTTGNYYSTNYHISSSTATTTLTAKYDMTFTVLYGVSSEANYDKFTWVVNGTTVANAISGTASGTYTVNLLAGQSMTLTYTKDSSVNRNNDIGYIGPTSGGPITLTYWTE